VDESAVITAQLTMDGLGHTWSKGYQKAFFCCGKKVSQAKQSEISSEQSFSQGTCTACAIS